MKKPLYYLLPFFAAAMSFLLVSCSDKDEPDGGKSFTFPTDVGFINTMEGVWLGEQGMSYMIFTTQSWPSAFGYARSAILWDDDYSCVGGSMAGTPVREGDHYYLSQSSGLFHDMWITAYEPGKRIVMKNLKNDETRSFVYSATSGIARVRLTENLRGNHSSVDITVSVYVNNDDAEPDYSITLEEMSGYTGGVSDPFWLCGEKVVASFYNCITGELLDTATWTDLDHNTIYNLNY